MLSIFHSLACWVLAGIAVEACPLLGPVFPVPSGLSSNEQFQAATKLFDAALTATLKTGTSTNGPLPFNATTLSIAMFSTSERGLIYQRHYTDPSVRNSEAGTKNVDADSVYRLGSIGKLLTVYLFLIREGDQRFNDLVTKYIPELAAAAAASTPMSPNGITPNWSEITIGQLASHMSGLAKDYGLTEIGYPWATFPGLPPIPENQIPICNYLNPNGSYKACSRKEYLAGAMTEPALFHSGYSPVYSNTPFALLGLALQNISNSDLRTIFDECMVEALGLHGTSFTVPSNHQNGVIPGNTTSSLWDVDLGIFAPAGGYFSTTNDMATIGKAILNSTLLSKAQTRRWMKPATFTSGLNVAVGAPWEIFRTQVGGRTVDLYTKNGGLGAYSTMFVLVPDFDFGFSLLTASELTESVQGNIVWSISEMITSAVLPVLENVARDQAQATFAGHYVARDLNSSLTISVDDQPGLRVTLWVSNGTDFISAISGAYTGSDVDFRIQPNQLYSGNKAGFLGNWHTLPARTVVGPIDLNCMTWGTVGIVTYGNVGIEEFVFEIDPKTGQATSVQPKSLRITLERIS